MKRIFIFVIGLLIGAILLWIGGYDFDSRTPEVAFSAAWIIIIAFLASIYPCIKD